MYVLTLEKGRKVLMEFSCLFCSDSKYIFSMDSALTIYLSCNVRKNQDNYQTLLKKSRSNHFKYVPFHIHATVDCFLFFYLHESGTGR
jgi:hypothetical protein